MFFQLKLQTFLIKVGFYKAKIHKMARWHLVYHFLGPGGQKNQECSVISRWNRKYRYGVIYSDALVTTKMKIVSEQCVRVVIMTVSDQNKFREMCTTGTLCSCEVNLLKSYDQKIRKLERIWRMERRANLWGDLKRSDALLLNMCVHVCTQQSKPT